MLSLKGCMTAMITPFDRKLDVDYEGLRSNVRFQIANGVSGLVPLGTTGESPTISDGERAQIINTVVDEADGKVPIIVGVGTNSTEHTARYAREAKELGADAVLVVSPYYNKPSQEGLFRHFETITKDVDIPVVVYNIQSRTGINIDTNTLARIAKLRNVVGVKESSGSLPQMMDVVQRMPTGFAVLSGDDILTLPLMSVGGQGVISVVANLLPKRVSDLVDAAASGKFDRAMKIHYDLLPILKGAFMETNPVPIKAAMHLVGMPSGGVRQPLCSMSSENIEKMKALVSTYNELKRVDK